MGFIGGNFQRILTGIDPIMIDLLENPSKPFETPAINIYVTDSVSIQKSSNIRPFVLSS